MDSIFGMLAIIILGIAILATLIYLVLKAASYFKRTFGASLWPGVIALCFSLWRCNTPSCDSYILPQKLSSFSDNYPNTRGLFLPLL